MSASSCRASPPTCSPPSSAPTTRSAEAGLKYFVLGALASRHPALRHLPALRLHRHDPVRRHRRRRSARDGVSTGELFGLVFVLAGLAFKISAVPFHMWTPDVYEGAPTPVTAFFASAPKVAAMALLARVAVEAMGPATDAWRQIVIFAALASTVLGGVAAIGQTQHQAAARLPLDQQCRLRAGRPRRRRRRRASPSVLFYMAVYVVDDARHLPRACCGCATRTASRSRRSPASPACRAPGPVLALAHGDLHVQPRRHPAAVRLLAQVRWCSTRRSQADLTWLAAVGDRDLGDRRLLLPHDRQDDVFRRAGARPSPRRSEPVGAGLILACGPVRLAARLSRRSPLGSAATTPRRHRSVPIDGPVADPDRRRDRLDQRRRRRAGARGRARRPVAARRAPDRRQGPAGPGLAVAARQSLRQHPGPAAARAIRRRRRSRWSPRSRCTRRSRAYAPGVRIKWPNDLLVDGAKLAGILLERHGDAVVIGFGVNLAHHPDGLDRPATSLRRARRHGAGARRRSPRSLAEAFARWLGALAQRGPRAGPRGLARRRPSARHRAVAPSEGEGLFDGLDESGALRLRLADGTIRVIHAGDVFLI